jgi:hypothetical protein
MSDQKQKFPNSGALFPAKSRVHPKSPDVSGDINIERSLLRQLMDEQDGDSVKIKLSGWNRSSGYGDFISLVVNTYKPPVHVEEKTHTPPSDNSDIPF